MNKINTKIREKLIKNFDNKEYADAYMESFSIDRLSAQIHALRKQRGWSQEHLSDVSGIKQSRISRLESGNYDSLTLNTIFKLASAFDVAIGIQFKKFSDLIDDISSFTESKLTVEARVEDISHYKELISQSAEQVDYTELMKFIEDLNLALPSVIKEDNPFVRSGAVQKQFWNNPISNVIPFPKAA